MNLATKKKSPTPHQRANPTRKKILAAARKLFVQHGFSGTSMGKIAALAEVNHSLIFHHFSDKQGLWKAVKQDIVDKANAKQMVLPSTAPSLKKFLKSLLKQKIDFYRNSPDIIRMINWQRLEQSKATIGIGISDESQAWINAFKHYQQQGEINPKLKPEYILSLICSIASSAALDPNAFINSQKAFQDYIKFCTESLFKAITKLPGQPL